MLHWLANVGAPSLQMPSSPKLAPEYAKDLRGSDSLS
jgi:hypothetical protein